MTLFALLVAWLTRTVPRAGLRVETLLDGAGTRAAVLHTVRTHLGRATAGDTALFWFSGHGSHARCPEWAWFAEPTGQLQTLVCADSRTRGVPDLWDKELSVLRALNLLGPDASYRELAVTARTEVERRVTGQSPQLRPAASALADHGFLSPRPGPAGPAMWMRHVEGRWEIDAGAAHGLPPGAGLRVGVRGGTPEQQATVVEVRAHRSVVEPAGGWRPAHERPYPMVVRHVPTPPLTVAVAGTDPEAVRQLLPDLRTALNHRGRAPEVFIRLHNTSRRRLYCVLLALTPRFGVHAALFPGSFIAPGARGAALRGRRIRACRPDDVAAVPGARVRLRLVLVTAEEQVSPDPFLLPALGERAVHERGPLGARDLGDAGPDAGGYDWTTESLTLVTEKPPDR